MSLCDALCILLLHREGTLNVHLVYTITCVCQAMEKSVIILSRRERDTKSPTRGLKGFLTWET